jgi:hypothetical protein
MFKHCFIFHEHPQTMEFLLRDKKWVGALVGLVVPFVAFALLLMLNDWLEASKFRLPGNQTFAFDEKTLYVLAVCANLLPFRFYRLRRLDDTLTGIVLPTLVYVALFFVWYLLFPTFRLGVVEGI